MRPGRREWIIEAIDAHGGDRLRRNDPDRDTGDHPLNIDLLRRLTDAPGIAGFEDRVRDIVAAELQPLVDNLQVDRLGNLIATKQGTNSGDGPTILLVAHMDEIGFLVRFVDERGFVRLQPLGSFDPRALLAQRVDLHAQNGQRFVGVVATTVEPHHFAPPREARIPQVSDLFVDLSGYGTTIRDHVEIGDMVTLERSLYVAGYHIVSKALDDRLGLYVMIEALRQLGGHRATIIAVASAQEEVGSRGAVAAGFAVDPDICIALDLTLANDFPGMSPEQEVTRLGAGPAIKIMDTTQISHRGVVRHLRDLAHQHDIPIQLEVLNQGGTDASLIQRIRAGVAVVTLSLPARYIHTVNEMAHIGDVERGVTLLARYLEAAEERYLTAVVE